MNKNLVRLLFAWFLVTLAFFGGQALAATPSVSAGGTHTCAVLSIGSVQCWGDNDFGQLGNGSYTGSRVPTPVSGLANATTVSLGYYHACAVLGGGTVQCWGAGETLGNGTTTGSNVPVTVSGIANATSVSAGQSHTCALLTSGGVRCWGDNSYGQLGNGSYNYGNVPVTVSGISNAIAVSAGQFHTCALLIGGAIQCWGYNRSGRLGNGNTTDSKVPVTVSGIASATAVSAGGSRTCAVLSSGEVRCWGDNGFGQLGNGSHTGGIFSVAVSGIASATSVSVGQNHSCSVLGGGGIQCWGGNDGQLGNGSKTSSNVPVAVTGVANATVVSAGASHTCAVLGSGTVQCWGVSGYFNRLGDGSTSDSTIPVQVVGTNGQGFLNLGGSSYTLTTSKTGTGQGSIASSSTGIACGSDCTENYANGTTVTLTATPSSGSTFTGWSGACSGTATCTVSMSEAKNVVATFNLVTISSYTLTVSKTGFGEGNIASSTTGISCGSDCTESYVSGTSVTLIATPSSGSTFTGWSGACSGTGTCTISMSEAKTVSAGFSLVLVSNLGAPVVSVSPVGLALGRSAEGNPITGVPTGTLFSFDFAPVNNAASYKLFYKLPGGQYTTESSIAIQSGLKISLPGELRLSVVVKAYSATQESAYSNTIDLVMMDVSKRAYLDKDKTVANSSDVTNNFGPGESDNSVPSNFPTHWLYAPEEFHLSASDTPASFTSEVFDGTDSSGLQRIKDSIGKTALGSRTPIVLVHGWQGDSGKSTIKAQTAFELSGEKYWENLIKFFGRYYDLKNKYKLYVYKYPSYKRVTFNAQKLATMIDNVPELKGAPRVSFISHSMGTLVVRSLFEEHNFPVSRADKVIFLDGVHHGSPAAIPGLVVANTDQVFAKRDLFTPGANDIQWDGYDGLFQSEYRYKNSSIKDLVASTTNYGRLTEGSQFDAQYRGQLDRIASDSNSVYSLPVFRKYGRFAAMTLPNPWLASLNMVYHKLTTPEYKSKLYFYGAVNANGGGKNDLTVDNLKFNVAEDGVQRLTESPIVSNTFGAGFGYLNDGPVPLSGQMLDLNYTFDELAAASGTGGGSSVVTMYLPWINGGAIGSPRASGVAKYAPYGLGMAGTLGGNGEKNGDGSDRYEGNGYSKYRLFMDYDHDRMKAGCYAGDDVDLDTELTSQMPSPCFRKRETWLKNCLVASDNLVQCNKVLDQPINPLQFEPLFLSVMNDLAGVDVNKKLSDEDRIFNWAESALPQLFNSGKRLSFDDAVKDPSYIGRCYYKDVLSNTVIYPECIGAKDGNLYHFIHKSTDGAGVFTVTGLGRVSDFIGSATGAGF